MQTFLPFPNLKKSIICLDNKRLGKQRVESRQILDIITGIKPLSNWRFHPIVIMWEGYTDALKKYYNYSIDEWIRRGFKNTMIKYDTPEKVKLPYWFKDDQFHISHQSNLTRKYPEWYSNFWSTSPDMPYHWFTKAIFKQTADNITYCITRFTIDTEKHHRKIIEVKYFDYPLQ